MADVPSEDVGSIGLEEARNRLADAERLRAILEARLLQYQSALETIHSAARKALES